MLSKKENDKNSVQNLPEKQSTPVSVRLSFSGRKRHIVNDVGTEGRLPGELDKQQKTHSKKMFMRLAKAHSDMNHDMVLRMQCTTRWEMQTCIRPGYTFTCMHNPSFPLNQLQSKSVRRSFFMAGKVSGGKGAAGRNSKTSSNILTGPECKGLFVI